MSKKAIAWTCGIVSVPFILFTLGVFIYKVAHSADPLGNGAAASGLTAFILIAGGIILPKIEVP